MQVYHAQFSGQVEQLEKVHHFVSDAARELQLDEDAAFACRLAADEAATNAWEHSYSGQPGRVEVKLWRDDDDLYLIVRNWGTPFDPATIAEPRLDLPLDRRPVGGLGIFLLRKFMDDVSFGFDPAQGNIVRMRRKLGG